MKTCKEKALEWGLSSRSLNNMCKKGKIQGAIKEKGIWLIPDDAEKPADGRVTHGKYVKKTNRTDLKSLPIGISDYVRAQAEYYYVDKTLLIKEFLDQKPLVSLFTRPRRFGKTLNMDMLRVFFEISKEDTSKYFVDKNIWKCGDKYQAHQGKYPVIFLTFKDIKFDTWEATIDKIRGLLQEEYGRHKELLNSDKLSQYEKEYFSKILDVSANEVELTSALERLSKMLATHYGKAPIIIIDEYDTPIQEGYSKDFYDEIIGFMRNFFSGAFKDNKNLSYGFLTGILRIAQESIFSGLNNLTVSTVMDEEYDSFFGFTSYEVKEMLEYYGMADKESELKDWYDGYLFGSEEIYNPWSVINYISRGCIPQAYWANTGKNEILEDVMGVATDDITEKLYALLQGECVIARIDQNVVYRSLAEDPANIYSLLLVAGYLKAPRKELQADGSYLCEVSIPNREIAAVYKSEIISHLLQVGAITRTTANKIAESLYSNDYKKLQAAVGEYMDKSISFYDGGADAFNNCSGLESINIPNSVTSIGEQAFIYCSSLKSITIPNNVTVINDRTFSWCNNLESIFLSDKVSGIGTAAIPDVTSNIKYNLDEAKGEVTFIGIDLGTDKTAVAIPAEICGYPVVAAEEGLLGNISSHTCAGGQATCRTKATCGICKTEYGELDSSNHNLENIPAKAATVTETGNKEYWHCKDCGKYFYDRDGKNSIDLKDTVTPKLPTEIIEGMGQSLTAGETKELTFRSNSAISDFIRVELDGKTLDAADYTVKEGSTIITLKADYVGALSSGEHTISIVSTSGTATTTFTVKAKTVVDKNTKSPRTGDNSHMVLWIALLFVGGSLLTVTGVYGKKHSVK